MRALPLLLAWILILILDIVIVLYKYRTIANHWGEFFKISLVFVTLYFLNVFVSRIKNVFQASTKESSSQS